MDSGNSGSLSLQSSSGGDEFDSRCGGGGGEDSSQLSALLRQPPAPSSSALPGFGGAFYGIQDLASPSPLSHWSSSTTQLPAAGAGASTAPQSSSSDVVQAPASADHAAPGKQAPPRGSRKRARASRRAPTTVLTTDTSNFRAMVQEFTGIPAPPFAASSSRFDHHHLFPSRNHAAALSSPYLLRPFAHKLHQAPSSPYPHPPFVPATSSSSPANKAIVSSTTAPRLRTTAGASSGDSYQLASAPTSVLGMQDHSGGGGGGNYLSFQQSPILDGNASRYPAAAHPTFHAAGFSGLAHGVMSSEVTTHLHQARHSGHGGDELFGLVGAASVSNADGGCSKTAYSSRAGSSSRAASLLERNAQTATPVAGAAATTTTPAAATAGVRAQGVESSWICTSE